MLYGHPHGVNVTYSFKFLIVVDGVDEFGTFLKGHECKNWIQYPGWNWNNTQRSWMFGAFYSEICKLEPILMGIIELTPSPTWSRFKHFKLVCLLCN